MMAQFIDLGEQLINIDQITYIQKNNLDIEIFFADGTGEPGMVIANDTEQSLVLNIELLKKLLPIISKIEQDEE